MDKEYAMKLKKGIERAVERDPMDFEAYEDWFSLCRELEKAEFRMAHEWNHELRDRVNAILPKAVAVDMPLAENLANLQKRSLLFSAPHYFDDYLQAVEYDKPLAKKFYLPRRHYLKRYVDAYQDVLDGKLDFLSISMPKRSGKLIAHDYLVRTADGFKKHGDLVPGDVVFGKRGEPVRVLAKHPDDWAVCEVVFSDGSAVPVSKEHEWEVYDRETRKTTIMETQKIAALGMRATDGFYRFVVPRVLRTEHNAVIGTRIMDIRPLSKPVVGNCITVEGGFYCVGPNDVVTHNSQLGINFATMLSGKNPDKSTLMEGTGDDLVNSFYKGCLEYLAVPSEYCFYDIFPGLEVTQTNADMKIFNLATKSRFPTVMCRSIDARQVGLSEATNLLYLDDLVEGREEAKNRRRLDEKWEVISGDILGRAIEGTPIVVCGTRYSLYDPMGRLQEEMRKQEKRMEIIETPALDPITDESNFEYIRDGKKVFTTKYFRDQRTMLSAEQWESEFQQQPFEAKGLLFPKDQLNYYFELPVDKDPDTIVCVCDTAESGEDALAMPIAAVYGDEVYIVDVVFDDSPAIVTKPEVVRKIINNRVVAGTFESNNAGEYYARDIQQMLDQNGYICSIRTKRTLSNKQTRMEMAADNIIKHFYFKHASTYKRGSQYDFFMRQVVTHTRVTKKGHDDAPDSLALLENELRRYLGSQQYDIIKRAF